MRAPRIERRRAHVRGRRRNGVLVDRRRFSTPSGAWAALSTRRHWRKLERWTARGGRRDICCHAVVVCRILPCRAVSLCARRKDLVTRDAVYDGASPHSDPEQGKATRVSAFFLCIPRHRACDPTSRSVARLQRRLRAMDRPETFEDNGAGSAVHASAWQTEPPRQHQAVEAPLIGRRWG